MKEFKVIILAQEDYHFTDFQVYTKTIDEIKPQLEERKLFWQGEFDHQTQIFDSVNLEIANFENAESKKGDGTITKLKHLYNDKRRASNDKNNAEDQLIEIDRCLTWIDTCEIGACSAQEADKKDDFQSLYFEFYDILIRVK